MSSVFEKSLSVFGPLPSEDTALINKALVNLSTVAAGQIIAYEGSSPSCIHIIISGAACISTISKNGRRQITAILIPGDFCSMQSCFGSIVDFSISALDKTSFIKIAKLDVEIMMERPALANAFLKMNIRKEAMYRAWISNVGLRTSVQRLAYLLVETYMRLSSVDLTTNQALSMRISQYQIADALGLSYVHVNRAFKVLRQSGFVSTLSGRYIKLVDVTGLERLAEFRGEYLRSHL